MTPPPLLVAMLLLLLMLLVLLVLLLLVELVLQHVPANRTHERGAHGREPATPGRVGGVACGAGPHDRAHQAALVLPWLPWLSSVLLAVSGSSAALRLVAVLLLWLVLVVLGGILWLLGWILLVAAVALVLLLLLLVRRGTCVLVVLLLRGWVIPALVVGGMGRVALEVSESVSRVLRCPCGACICDDRGGGAIAYLLGVVAGLSVALATVLVLLVVAAAAAGVIVVSRHDVLFLFLLLFAKTG